MKETSFKTKKAFNEEQVIEFYDEYAPDWDSRFEKTLSTSHFINRRWKSFDEAVRSCDGEMTNCLELGVGTGAYLKKCSSLFKFILAVDGSSRMISELTIKIEKSKIRNVKPMIANAVNLNQVADSSIDCVYFFGLLEHSIDTNTFVLEIRRVLRPNGFVIGVTPNGLSPWFSIRGLIRGTGKHCSSDRYFTLPEINSLFEQRQFTLLHSEYWGLVPAGSRGFIGAFLRFLEPIVEKTPGKYWLGGLTFAYKLSKQS